MINVKIEPSWNELLETEFDQSYFHELVEFVKSEYKKYKVFPLGSRIFSAFDLCPVERVRVVIIGQDPYHGVGQANGLCFSVNEGVPMPPSLLNIFKELKTDLGKDIPADGCLDRWARQGVLLLNATLTVRASAPGSHQNKGWELFTDAIIKKLSDTKEGIVFILWGAYAQKKGQVIDTSRHLILSSPHPSPFAANRGFFGSRPFSKTNEYLQRRNQQPIAW